MKIEKIEGVVVNEKDYGETSKLVYIMTRKYGLISVMAKGAKKIKAPYSFF